MISKKDKIGILGGSFDPAHKGHIAISKEAFKKFGLKSVIWAITSQNPFKKKTSNNLKKRISFCKKLIKNNKFIKVKYFEDLSIISLNIHPALLIKIDPRKNKNI